MAEDDEDLDVVWKGSPLHCHLRDMGLDNDTPLEDHNGQIPDILEVEESAPMQPVSPVHKELAKEIDLPDDSELLNSARSFMWPSEDSLVLEVNVAKAILESELLVQEDEEFLSNFVLNEEILSEYHRHMEETPSRTSSLFSDVILFSGSIVAVAGAVLYLSEKAKAATAAAAILPAAMAAMTSVRIGTKVNQDSESEHFHQIINLLLSDMKHFKQLVRKSLNLLQGMEMVSDGSYLSVDTSTGATSVAAGGARSYPTSEESKLARALGGRTTFPALRLAAKRCTVQIIQAYREAVLKLMKVSPLADHVDLREHYIAFVDLENFGIQPIESEGLHNNQSDLVTVQELKETAQVALVQQSEYLRRFSLTFCERVREDNVVNKAGVLKHIRDLLATIRKINNKMSRVLEYHQAMGLDMEKIANHKRALALKGAPYSRRLPHIQKFVPLRSIYTSMFTTGLHLQHSLLKIRKLEELFDKMDRESKRTKASPSLKSPIDDANLVDWLRGFQEIQAELNACVGCLDEGVGQIDVLQQKANKTTDDDHETHGGNSVDDFQVPNNGGHHSPAADAHLYNADTITPYIDEVFEAVITTDDFIARNILSSDQEPVDSEMSKQSGRVLRELKKVLVHKAAEHEFREAQAIARQEGRPAALKMDAFGLPHKIKGKKRVAVIRSFDDSFAEFAKQPTSGELEDLGNDADSSSSSSSSSQCPTVKSMSPKRVVSNDPSLPRSISGQLLESDDEEWMNGGARSVTESCSRLDWEDSDNTEYSLTSGAQGLSSLASSSRYTMSVTSLTEIHATTREERNGTCSRPLGYVRSLSTPDLKTLIASGRSYKVLSATTSKAQENADDTASSSSSDWGSADELERHILKSYSRPLRPAAAKKNVSRQPVVKKDRKTRDRQKRARNRSNIFRDGPEVSSRVGSNGYHPPSQYMLRHQREDNPLSIPSQSSAGFEGTIAAEVAAKARSFMGAHGPSAVFLANEEVIGDDESSDDGGPAAVAPDNEKDLT
jgi:hypothetical protein